MRRAVVTMVLAVGCGGEPKGDCVYLPEGQWSTTGAASGMVDGQGATLTLTGDDCSFTFSSWDLLSSPEPVPTGGSVAGSALTLTGSPYFDACAGTVNGAVNAVTGICDDGIGFEMFFYNDEAPPF